MSLHAAVRCGGDERQALEQLCRYITRPALANERVQCNAAGQVVLKLKTAWRERLFRGDHFRALNVAEGSKAQFERRLRGHRGSVLPRKSRLIAEH